jgi:hypothetical protein
MIVLSFIALFALLGILSSFDKQIKSSNRKLKNLTVKKFI